MVQRTQMHVFPFLLIILLLAQSVTAAEPILVVGKISPIPYDIYLCREKSSVDDIIEVQREAGLSVAQATVDQYAREGMCDIRTAVYIQVDDIYYTATLGVDGEKHSVAVVCIRMSDGEILYGAVAIEDLSLRSS